MVRAREVNRRIEKLGGEFLRQKGSHARYRVVKNGVTVSTTVPQHSGDIPKGTLDAIEEQLAPALGEGWLGR